MRFPSRRGELSSAPRRSPSTGLTGSFRKSGKRCVQLRSFLKTYKIFGLYAEVPVAIYPRMNLNYFPGQYPEGHRGCVYHSLGAREYFFRRLGYAVGERGRRIRPLSGISGTLYEDPNPGPTAPIPASSSSGPDWTCGSGIDWGARFEARDFYSGDPRSECDYGQQPPAQLLCGSWCNTPFLAWLVAGMSATASGFRALSETDSSWRLALARRSVRSPAASSVSAVQYP